MYKENTLLEFALKYYDMGLQPIPIGEITLDEKGKKKFFPLIGWKDKGDNPFTRDEVIENFDLANVKNIGIRTGKVSNLIVIDVDQDADKVFIEEYLSGLQTVVVYTQSGGKHHWFKHPGFHVKTCAGELAKGIDVRGDGGFVFAPPSKTKEGGLYVFQ